MIDILTGGAIPLPPPSSEKQEQTTMEPLSLFNEHEVTTVEGRLLQRKTENALGPILHEFVAKCGHKSREVEWVIHTAVAAMFAKHRLTAAAQRRKDKKAG